MDAPPTTTTSSNPFARIPRDVQWSMVEFVGTNNIPDLTKWASCDKYLFDLLYCQLRRRLWEHVIIQPEWGIRNDAPLHALLSRIDAKNTIKTLILKDVSVTGVGLAPLQGSLVLELIDLRVKITNDTRTGLDDQMVANILRESVNSGALQQIKCNGSSFISSHSPDLGVLLVKLALKEAEGLRENETKCDHCHAVLTTIPRSTSTILSNATHNLKCTTCKRYTCQPWTQNAGDCPFMDTCKACSNKSCRHCTSRCTRCYNSFCNGCEDMEHCCTISCNGQYCSLCSPGLEICPGCEGSLCQRCTIIRCGICNDRYCDQCYEDEEICHCHTCQDFYCTSCRKMEFCECCDTYNCAVSYDTCVSCQERRCKGCLDDEGVTCGVCSGHHCVGCFENHCLEAFFCSSCEEFYCDSCRVAIPCASCDETLCDVCIGNKKCADCDDVQFCQSCFPSSNLKECSACKKFICGDCVQVCFDCNKPFCKSDWNLLSDCASCSNIVCYDCHDKHVRCVTCTKKLSNGCSVVGHECVPKKKRDAEEAVSCLCGKVIVPNSSKRRKLMCCFLSPSSK